MIRMPASREFAISLDDETTVRRELRLSPENGFTRYSIAHAYDDPGGDVDIASLFAKKICGESTCHSSIRPMRASGTTSLSSRGRLRKLHAFRKLDGGPGLLQRMIRPGDYCSCALASVSGATAVGSAGTPPFALPGASSPICLSQE